MAACQHMDESITKFKVACTAEAKAKKIPVRHDVFSAAYVMDPKAAISKLIYFIHCGFLSFRREEGQGFRQALRQAWTPAETPGQFYFLIRFTRISTHDKETAQYVAWLLKNIRVYPYHLQLDLIEFAKYFHEAREPYRTEIIEAQASLDKLAGMMNTIIFEALNDLGALEEEEQSYIPVIRGEIQDALTTEGTEADTVAGASFRGSLIILSARPTGKEYKDLMTQDESYFSRRHVAVQMRPTFCSWQSSYAAI